MIIRADYMEEKKKRICKRCLLREMEIEDYKKGKIDLESYEDVQALRKALINEK